MTPNEANEILKNKVNELIVKMNAQANASKIQTMVDAYLAECNTNSHYDQVANINNLVAMYERGDVKGFLGAIQYKDTLTHINKL